MPPKIPAKPEDDFHKALTEHELLTSDDVSVPDLGGWDVDQLIPPKYLHTPSHQPLPANIKERAYPEPPMPGHEPADTLPVAAVKRTIVDQPDLETSDDEQPDLKKMAPDLYAFQQLKKKQANLRYRLQKAEGNPLTASRLQQLLAENQKDIENFTSDLVKDPFAVAARSLATQKYTRTTKLWAPVTKKWVEIDPSLKDHPIRQEINFDKNTVRNLRYTMAKKPIQYDSAYYHKRVTDLEQQIENNIQSLKKISNKIPVNFPTTEEQPEPSLAPPDQDIGELFTNEDMHSMIDKFFKK